MNPEHIKQAFEVCEHMNALQQIHQRMDQRFRKRAKYGRAWLKMGKNFGGVTEYPKRTPSYEALIAWRNFRKGEK